MLNESNLIDAESGTIALASTQGTVTGTLNTAAGASIDLTDGDSGLIYEGTLVTTGSGTLLLDDDGALTLGADTTFDFPPRMFQWTSGEIDTNGYTLTNATGSYLNVDTGDYGLELHGPGTLVNDGTIIQTGGAALDLDATATTIDNQSGGVYDVQANSGIEGSGTFDNEGTLEKTAGTGTFLISSGIVLNESNLIDAESGTIALASFQGTVIGTLNTAAGATIDLTDGDAGLDY